jgi:hypothetical protein
MTRMIVLAGAPEPSKLDWTEKSLSSTTHLEDISQSVTSFMTSDSAPTKPFSASWRQVSTDKLQMRPVLPKLDIGRPQPTAEDSQSTEFFTPSDFVGQESPSSDVSGDESNPSGTSLESSPEALDEFYDHSFTIHEAIPSSELSQTDAPPQTPVYESRQDMLTPQTPGIIRTSSQRRLSQAPRPNMIWDLARIPNAQYLIKIQPQTMTVNIIAGVIDIGPPRKVTTGRAHGRPRQAELVELTLGDDTKTGFNVTLWMPPNMHVGWRDDAQANNQAGGRSTLRRSVKEIRPRDVIMLQHVALSEYRGKVHGQSLKGDVTKLDLLFRRKVDDDDLQGCYNASNLRNPAEPQTRKVKAVRDWVNDFVVDADGIAQARTKKGRKGRLMLPDDTQ